MKQRQQYMLCCDCGLAVKRSTMFIKEYQNTAICLCRKCSLKLASEISDDTKSVKENEKDE